MSASLTPEQRWQYQLSFSLKVRSSFGTHFQDFFSTVMEKVHKVDFVRIRPFGALGDKGCDGYLQSTGQVFQCYGKLDDAPVHVSALVAKLGNDYNLAFANLSSIMKEWHFAHNLVNGIPTDAIIKIEEMRVAYPQHKFGLIGPDGLEDRVLKLCVEDLYLLLGPAATAEDSRNLRLEEVRDLIDVVMHAINAAPKIDDEIAAVPREKLVFNRLPPHWCGLIGLGMQNAAYVKQYIDQHRDAEVGEKLAQIFNERYRALKLEGLSPSGIMDKLYELITGVGSVTSQRQVAAQALLAHLFESCDIFEDKPIELAE